MKEDARLTRRTVLLLVAAGIMTIMAALFWKQSAGDCTVVQAPTPVWRKDAARGAERVAVEEGAQPRLLRVQDDDADEPPLNQEGPHRCTPVDDIANPRDATAIPAMCLWLVSAASLGVDLRRHRRRVRQQRRRERHYRRSMEAWQAAQGSGRVTGARPEPRQAFGPATEREGVQGEAGSDQDYRMSPGRVAGTAADDSDRGEG